MLASMLATMSAPAADWTVKIHPVALNPNDTVYIQNVATGRYLGSGEAWGTQAVVNELAKAGKCVLRQLADGTYQINNDVKGWTHVVFRTAGDGTMGKGVKGCFVDYGEDRDVKPTRWSVNDIGNNVYTFQVPDLPDYQLTEESTPEDSLYGHIEGQYLGVNRNHASKSKVDGITWGLYYDAVYADSAENCQFVFLPVNIVDAKAKLLSVVEKAASSNLDVTAGAALLADGNATIEAMEAEVDRIVDRLESVASPTNPQDITTKYISNPTPLGKGTPAGWTVLNREGNPGSTGDSDNGVGEFWNKLGYTLKYTIHQLPAGIYRFTAIALTRTGMHGKFFVNEKSMDIATVGSGTVNWRPEAKRWFTEDEDGDGITNGTNTITLVLPEAAEVTLGLMADTTQANKDGWTVWREFKLESLGSGLETFQYVCKDILAQANAISESGVDFTASYYDECKELALAGETATNKAEATEKYLAANAKLEELKANVAAWDKLIELLGDLDEKAYNIEDNEALVDLMDQASSMLDELNATNEEINDMYQKLISTYDYLLKGGYAPGDDVTNLIVNPTFNDENAEPNDKQPQSTEGWQGATFGAGGTVDSRLCEVYEGDFNTYQDITGMKPGAYELSIQAFMRPAGSTATWARYQAGNKEVPAWIYLNGFEQRIHNICDQTFAEALDSKSSYVTLEDGVVIPNTMAAAFSVMSADADYYNNKVVGIVGKDGKMRIGIKAKDPEATSGRWVLFHDFTMTYLGSDAQYLKPALNDKVGQMKAIVAPMGADERTLLNKAIAAAEVAAAGNNGEAMLEALEGLAAVADTVNVSISAYKALQSSLDTLTSVSQQGAAQAAIDKANALISEVTAAIVNGSIAIADVPAKQAEMAKARKALMTKEGSDDAPANYCSWIVNPTFAEGMNGWTVETISGSNIGALDNCVEIWNSTGDVHQDITGLPAGTYQVKVKAFFRQQSADRAWLEMLGDSVQDISRVRVYANFEVKQPNLWATREYKGMFSATGKTWYEAIDSVQADNELYFLPNERESARIIFDANAYQMSFYTYVNESGLLRLGFANDGNIGKDWLVLGDWELYYLGNNSSHADATGIHSADTNEKVKFNEIYSVDGRRMGTLQKGVNILRGKTAEGKVVTKKVILK